MSMLRHPTGDFRGALSVTVDREMPLQLRAPSVLVEHPSHLSRSESAVDSMFAAFPFGKPVPTFPGNACYLRRSPVRGRWCFSRVAGSTPSGLGEIAGNVLAAYSRATRILVKCPYFDAPSGHARPSETRRGAANLFRKGTCSALVTGFSKQR